MTTELVLEITPPSSVTATLQATDVALDLGLADAQPLDVLLQPDSPALALDLTAPPALPVDLAPTRAPLALTLRQPDALDADLLPVLVGPPGAGGATISTQPDNLLTNDSASALLVPAAAVRAVAADQDAVLIYNFDALVAATLGV